MFPPISQVLQQRNDKLIPVVIRWKHKKLKLLSLEARLAPRVQATQVFIEFPFKKAMSRV